MGFLDTINDIRTKGFRNWLMDPMLTLEFEQRRKIADTQRRYRQGKQRRFLKKSEAGVDDNLVINFAGLVIDRSVTMLFGKGIKFDLPGDEGLPEDEYIKAVMRANKQPILLHKTALFGGEQGTCYLKILPDELPDPREDAPEKDGEPAMLPRLVPVDPALVVMRTNPSDIDDVVKYVIEYKVTLAGDKERAYRQEIYRDDGVEIDADGQQVMTSDIVWWIDDYVSDDTTQNKWVLQKRQMWEYDFAPIVHWQNLPEPTDVYGLPDVTDDVMELQDRINFMASNISKIIRLYANPLRYGVGLGNVTDIDAGPDKMLSFGGENAKIEQLEPLGDLAAAFQFFLGLRQSLFDTTQTVDHTSMADKIGALTNFGLKVLYQDALAKLGTKRELYADGLLELVRRLLVIGEFQNTDPGKIVWPEVLPVDEIGQTSALRADRELGVVSKQTVALKRGYNWELEEERISEEATGDDLASTLLRAFETQR